MSSAAVLTVQDYRRLCENQFRQIDRAIPRWKEKSEAFGEFFEAEYANILERQKHIRELFEQARFRMAFREAAAALAFIESDLKMRHERAIALAAEKRELQRIEREKAQLRLRRQQENAVALLGALQTRSVPVAPEMAQNLRSLASGTVIADAEKWLGQGFALLTAPGLNETLSEAHRDLARRLQEEANPAALDEWLAEHRPPRDQRLLRIDRYIAELSLLQDEDTARPFLEKLAAAEAENQDTRRNLLLDSLMLDLGTVTRDWHQICEQRSQLRDLIEFLSDCEEGAAQSDLIARARACCAMPRPDLKQLSALLESVRAAFVDIQAKMQTKSSRQAILSGLASLGYEVHESMETLWAEKGRVVLKKSVNPDYGLEIGGKTNNGRMQTRVVALSADRDEGHDRDMETRWCSEFKQLQSLLKSQGYETVVEQEREPGETPLKLVENAERIESRRGNFSTINR